MEERIKELENQVKVLTESVEKLQSELLNKVNDATLSQAIHSLDKKINSKVDKDKLHDLLGDKELADFTSDFGLSTAHKKTSGFITVPDEVFKYKKS